MVTTKLYLDRRAVKNGTDAPIKITICKKGETSMYSTGIRIPPNCWDRKRQKVINHPNAAKVNNRLTRIKLEFDEALAELYDKEQLVGLSATQIKNKVSLYLSPEARKDDSLLCSRFDIYIIRCKAERTKEIYRNTLKKIRLFDRKADKLHFDDITKAWLDNFEKWLTNRGNKINTISIDMRNIRAVINAAIDDEITTAYPFRKKKIRGEKTRKRSLSVEKIREVFKSDNRYADIFKLSFLLIGMNIVDMYSLKKIEDGRANYKRSKTGREYSIKIEPEALELINRYRGEERALCFAEIFSDYKTITKKADKALKAFCEGLSLYWARHSWATIAASLDIPNETIAAALGHSYGNRTTAIYIDYDMKKVDEANRKVIDWVFYGKR